MLEAVKRALALKTDAYDEQLEGLIAAGLKDMEIAGVVISDETDPIVLQAIITYCRMSFKSPDDYDRLRASYETQKGQLRIATGYTNWGDAV